PEKASPTSEDQAEEQSSNDEHFHGEVDGDAEQFSHVSPASVDEPDDVTSGRAGRLDLRDANRQDTAGRDVLEGDGGASLGDHGDVATRAYEQGVRVEVGGIGGRHREGVTGWRDERRVVHQAFSRSVMRCSKSSRMARRLAPPGVPSMTASTSPS